MTSHTGGVPVGLCPLSQLLDIVEELEGKRVTLMGLGLWGGGEGAARMLVDMGVSLTVTDLRPAEKLAPVLPRLRGLPIRYRLGGHVAEDFMGTDLVVANPGVPRTSPFLRRASGAGVPITSPMNLLLALCPAPIAGVTGSNGKSTTSVLLKQMIERSGRRVWLGGNIGGSLLPSLSSIRPTDAVVLELSSFQLEDAAALRWSPHVAVITNITPNHLDRHGTFEAYAAAKQHIVAHQCERDFAVLNAEDAELAGWVRRGLRGRLYYFNAEPHPGHIARGISLMGDRLVCHDEGRIEVLCLRQDVRLPGRHNVENAMAAATAARCLGVESARIRKALSGFNGLEHRLELVGERRGVRYYNDSFSTTPQSSIAALESFHGPLTLIAGGYDKNLGVDEMARAFARRAEVLITVGQTGPALARQTRRESLCVGRPVIIREAGSLAEAVTAADELSMPGSAVILSPGSASYDMFDNCVERGERFKKLVDARLNAARRSA